MLPRRARVRRDGRVSHWPYIDASIFCRFADKNPLWPEEARHGRGNPLRHIRHGRPRGIENDQTTILFISLLPISLQQVASSLRGLRKYARRITVDNVRSMVGTVEWTIRASSMTRNRGSMISIFRSGTCHARINQKCLTTANSLASARGHGHNLNQTTIVTTKYRPNRGRLLVE